jgi:iron complex outermembrane receptor protein
MWDDARQTLGSTGLRTLVPACILCLFLAPRNAWAADEAQQVPEVRVREPQPAGFVSERRMDDASREITDAASLVESAPGVHVRRLGADDSFSTLSVRGTSSTEVAIYLAGVPLSGGADPTLDLATLPLWPGARARVYRSFSPAALGRGSLGGVLSLDPPSLRSEERSEVWMGVGSFGARRLRIGDVRAIGDLRLSTAVSASRSDDDFTYSDMGSGNPDSTVTRQNAGHAAVNGLVSLGIPVHVDGKEGALTITTMAQSRRQELPGTAQNNTLYARLDSTRIVSGMELSLPVAAGTLITRAWGRRESLIGRDSPREAAGYPTYASDVIVAAGASTGFRFRPAEAALVDVRIDGSGERYAPAAFQGVTRMPFSANRSQAGVALDAATSTHGLRLALSGRIDDTADASDDPALKPQGDLVPTGHLGVETDAGPLTLAAHGGALSRPASFVERYGNNGAFIGDPTLRPESAATADVGARSTFGVGPLRISAELAGFATWASDLIVFVAQGQGGSLLAKNIGQARILGLEAAVIARLEKGELHASYTGLSTENESECAAVTGTCKRPPLVGRPAHDLVADLAYAAGPVRLRVGGDFVSGISADLGNTIGVPSRFLTSAGLRLALPFAVGKTTLAFDVRNLFDVRTGTYDGVLGPVRAPIGDQFQYPLPGRSFLATLRFEARASAEP